MDGRSYGSYYSTGTADKARETSTSYGRTYGNMYGAAETAPYYSQTGYAYASSTPSAPTHLATAPVSTSNYSMYKTPESTSHRPSVSQSVYSYSHQGTSSGATSDRRDYSAYGNARSSTEGQKAAYGSSTNSYGKAAFEGQAYSYQKKKTEERPMWYERPSTIDKPSSVAPQPVPPPKSSIVDDLSLSKLSKDQQGRLLRALQSVSGSDTKLVEDSKYDTSIYIGMEDAPTEFQAIRRILGDNDENLSYLRRSSKARIELRGKGTGVSVNKPTYLFIGHETLEGMQKAEKLALSLIKVVQKEFEEWNAKRQREVSYVSKGYSEAPPSRPVSNIHVGRHEEAKEYVSYPTIMKGSGYPGRTITTKPEKRPDGFHADAKNYTYVVTQSTVSTHGDRDSYKQEDPFQRKSGDYYSEQRDSRSMQSSSRVEYRREPWKSSDPDRYQSTSSSYERSYPHKARWSPSRSPPSKRATYYSSRSLERDSPRRSPYRSPPRRHHYRSPPRVSPPRSRGREYDFRRRSRSTERYYPSHRRRSYSRTPSPYYIPSYKRTISRSPESRERSRERIYGRKRSHTPDKATKASEKKIMKPRKDPKSILKSSSETKKVVVQKSGTQKTTPTSKSSLGVVAKSGPVKYVYKTQAGVNKASPAKPAQVKPESKTSLGVTKTPPAKSAPTKSEPKTSLGENKAPVAKSVQAKSEPKAPAGTSKTVSKDPGNIKPSNGASATAEQDLKALDAIKLMYDGPGSNEGKTSPPVAETSDAAKATAAQQDQAKDKTASEDTGAKAGTKEPSPSDGVQPGEVTEKTDPEGVSGQSEGSSGQSGPAELQFGIPPEMQEEQDEKLAEEDHLYQPPEQTRKQLFKQLMFIPNSTTVFKGMATPVKKYARRVPENVLNEAILKQDFSKLHPIDIKAKFKREKKHNVWIMGDMQVYLMALQSETHLNGPALGLVDTNVTWLADPNVTIGKMLDMFRKKQTSEDVHSLVLLVGTGDLAKQTADADPAKEENVLRGLRKLLSSLKTMLPFTKVIWCELPQLLHNPSHVQRLRERINEQAWRFTSTSYIETNGVLSIGTNIFADGGIYVNRKGASMLIYCIRNYLLCSPQ